jgi:hypothetical protein
MQYLVTRSSFALGILAAVVLIGFSGLLVKLRADASSAPFTGPTANDVSKVWRGRWSDMDKLTKRLVHDVGCDANGGTSTFTCRVVFSTDSKHSLTESVVVSPTSYCTGSKRCMVVDNRYFTLGRAKETGDKNLLVSLFAGLD